MTKTNISGVNLKSLGRCRTFLVIGIVILLNGLSVSGVLAFDFGETFDHDQTRFPLELRHALVNCESCHLDGIFAGTPLRCATCHSNQGRIKASAPSNRHIRVTGDCEFCHSSASWTRVVRVDHSAVVGNCVACHNGVTSIGKQPGHIPSSNVCEDCHNTFNWRFYHQNIDSNCVSCHNGTIATGKNPAHILSTSNCEDCHRTSQWTSVLRVDHRSVIGTCFSCHNGVTATGKQPAHIPSSNDCSLCHSVIGWTPAFP